jgi:hypothetical protein
MALNGNSWHSPDIAPTAKNGIEPDIRNFTPTAGLSALLPSVESAANDWIEPRPTIINRAKFSF